MTALVVSQIGVARDRLLSTALDLFVQHGVGNTSLEMISEALGVPKATIRHQFPTKAALLLAVMTPILAKMERVADGAQRQRSVSGRRAAVLSGLVDLVIENRRLAAVLYAEHSVSQLIHEHPPMLAICQRLNHLLVGPDDGADTLVAVAVVGGGLMMVGQTPELADLDDETLHRHLLGSARRTLGLRTPPRRRT